MILSKEQIEQINENTPYEQGIFKEPYGIPVHIKEPVIYMRYETGGMTGGNCWNDNDPYRYEKDDVPAFEVLDAVLKVLKPDISYLDYKQVEKLIHTNEETEYEYYGNSTDYAIKYIILSELYELLRKIN